MVKRITLLFILLISGQLLFAQSDSVLKGQLTIKINPIMLFYEQGLTLQYNTEEDFGIILGAGYNEDRSGNLNFGGVGGNGYTIRAGLLRYLDEKKKFYFLYEGFIRYWGSITAVAEDDQGFTQGIDDEVINPFRNNLNSVSVGDGNQVDVYNAKVEVICNDVIWGWQVRKKHFVLDVYGGIGWRSKTIDLTETGYYTNPLDGSIGPFIPLSQPMSKTVYASYLDAQAGFTLGYRFYK
jgi:hypothetical protein